MGVVISKYFFFLLYIKSASSLISTYLISLKRWEMQGSSSSDYEENLPKRHLEVLHKQISTRNEATTVQIVVVLLYWSWQ